MGKQTKVVLYSMLIILLLLTACSPKDEASDPLPSETPGDMSDQGKAPEDNTSLPEDRKKADFEIETGNKAENASKAKNAPADQGEVNVWITGEVTVNENTITVSGQTNLLPGSSINGDISAKGYTVFGYNDKSTVESDGHFVMEIKKPKVKGMADIMIYFRPSSESESVQEVYGEAGEQLQGPYVYRYEEAGEIRRQIQAFAHVDVTAETGKKVALETPEWNPPDDYGQPNVWIKPEVTFDDEYYYVSAASNLLEGTKVKAAIDIPDHIVVGYDDVSHVLPDGSLELQVKKPKDAESLYLVLQFTPEQSMWPEAVEAYGEKGEKLQGEYVTTEQTNEGDLNKIEVKMKINSKE